MNTLIISVLVGVITRGCTTDPLQGTTTRQENVHKKRSVEQQGWASLGYTGPTAVPMVLGDGTIAETPEVAAARAAHLAALAISRGTNHDMDDGHYDPHKYGDHLYGVVPHSGDLSKSINTYKTSAQGHSSSAAVTGAQRTSGNALNAAHSQANASSEAALALWKDKSTVAGVHSYSGPVEQNKPYTGALAMLQLLPTGYLADTLEVAAAKKTHLSALAESQAANALWKAKSTLAGGHSYSAQAEQNKPYTGALAMLQLLPTGYLADTLEVAAAKKTHLSALVEAQAANALWRTKHHHTEHHPWN